MQSLENNARPMISTRKDYYTIPSINEIAQKNKGNHLFVENLMVGRKGYGSIKFFGSTDVTNLNLDENVVINRNEVIVYPLEISKPNIGEELNKKAEIILEGIWPHFKKLGTRAKNSEDNCIEYYEKLKIQTRKFGGKFIDYNFKNGTWIFRVDHFSKYGLVDTDDEDSQDFTSTAIQTDQDLNEVSHRHDIPCTNATTNSQEFVTSKNFEQIKHEDKEIFHPFYDNFSESGIPFLSSNLTSLINSTRDLSSIRTLFKDEELIDRDLYVDRFTIMEAVREKQAKYVNFKNLKSVKEQTVELSNIVTISSPEVQKKQHHLVPIRFKPLCSSLLFKKQKCLGDLGCFMSRSFRIGWGTAWKFAQLESKENTDHSQMKKCSPQSYFNSLRNEFGSKSILINKIEISANLFLFNKEHLNSHMEKQLIHSSLKSFPEMCPIAIPCAGNESLKSHTDLATENLSCLNPSHANYKLYAQVFQVFQLCSGLWGDLNGLQNNTTYAKAISRKHAVSEWIKKSVAMRPFYFGQKYPADQVKYIFSKLTAGKIKEAVDVATKTSNHRLAMLISQTGSHDGKFYLQKQLDTWNCYKMDNYIDPPRLKIFALLAGRLMVAYPNGIEINCCEGLDWRSVFGIHLWYHCGVNATINDALEAYEKGFKDTKYAPPPYPHYKEKNKEGKPKLLDSEEEGPLDICFHLLKLYSDKSYSISKVLTTSTYTSCPLDSSLSWLLYQTLLAINYGPLPCQQSEKLHCDFAAQLECLGMWKWAVFVVLHIENPYRRSSMVKELLFRHLTFDSDQSTELFLLETLKLPKEWLFEARAMPIHDDPKTKSIFLMKAGMYDASYKIIMRKIVPEAVINKDFPLLKSFLEPFTKVPAKVRNVDWALGGEMILDYIYVTETLNNILKFKAGKENLENVEIKLVVIAQKLQSMRALTSKEILCKAELTRKILNSLVIILELRTARENKKEVPLGMFIPYLKRLPLCSDHVLFELQEMIKRNLKSL